MDKLLRSVGFSYFKEITPWAAFYFLIFLPILGAGYYGDDIFNSLIVGDMKFYDSSLLERIIDLSVFWATKSGRIAVGAHASYSTFHYVFDTQLSYQIARSVTIILSLLVFAWFIFLVTKKKENGLSLMLLVPSLWFSQIFCDSLTSFDVILPLTAIFIALTACFFVKYREGKSNYKYLSLLSFIAALLVYDLGILAIMIPAVLVFKDLLKTSKLTKGTFYYEFLRELLPYIIIAILWVITVFYFRIQNEEINYDGLRFGNLRNVIVALIVQLSGTIPLTTYNNRVSAYDISLGYKICSILLIPISFFLIRKYLSQLNIGKKNYFILVSSGLILLFAPAFMVSLSEKYQSWSIQSVNSSYLQVYIQYIALALLILTRIDWHLSYMNEKNSKKFIIFVSLIFSLLISFANYYNYKIIHLRNIEGGYNQRILVEESLKKGLLSFASKRQISQETRPEIISIESIISGDVDKLMSRYPTTISSIDNIFSPSFLLEHSDIAANLVKFDLTDYRKFSGKTITKKISNNHNVFFIETNNHPEFNYVITAQVTEIDYEIIKSHPAILGYKISNPQIFFSEKFFLDPDDELKEIRGKFSSSEIHEFLNNLDLEEIEKNSRAVDLPKGSYRFRH